MSQRPPTVFVSHASEDKQRFVLEFAERLRAKGVDAWLDKWEMAPGDSLVSRIFDQGIGGADVFLIVLSEHSVTKPWVREELDAGVVLRIEGQCRIIPVLIDQVDVPVALKSTFWQRIADVSSYEDEFQAILRGIFGMTDKPPLGQPPAYTSSAPLPGMTQLDSLVLSMLCEIAVEDNELMVQGDRLREACAANDVDDDAFVEAVHALDAGGYIKEARIQPGVRYVWLSWSGLLAYLAAARPELGAVQHDLIAHLVNDPATSFEVSDLAAMTGQTTMIVEALLMHYESRDLLSISRYMGGRTTIRGISPLLRRELS